MLSPAHHITLYLTSFAVASHIQSGFMEADIVNLIYSFFETGCVHGSSKAILAVVLYTVAAPANHFYSSRVDDRPASRSAAPGEPQLPKS
jgi:hypothetical protein